MLEHVKSLSWAPKALMGAAVAAGATVIIAAAVSCFSPADACTEPRDEAADRSGRSSRADFARDFNASPTADDPASASGTDRAEADGPAGTEGRGRTSQETSEDFETPRRRPEVADLPPAQAARVRALGFMLNEFQRRSRMSWSRGSGELSEEEDEGEEPPDFSNIRQYLTYHDEVATDLLDVPDIMGSPSNIVEENSLVNLVAWDARNSEPRGSYLYVLQQDIESRIAQLHRYFCPERRLDILAETCIPIASVYSNSGVPVAVDYSSNDVPVQSEANDLDPALFSRATQYVEANDFLLYLQRYFDDMRA